MVLHRDVNPETAESCRDDRDHLVLVGIREHSDDVKRRVAWGSGVERLRQLDECYGRRCHLSESADNLILPTFPICADRELRVRISPVASSKAPSDVIEGRSKVVNTVTDHQAPSLFGDFWGPIEPYDRQIGCWIIDNKWISFRLNKVLDINLQSITVILRPSEFGVTVS